MLLEDKNTVIYGAGGAIGGTVARVFAREGARVLIAGRTQARLDAVAADIAAAGGAVETALVDAFDQRAVERHASAVAAKAGGIDIAHNAVSVVHDQGTLLADLSLDEFMRPIDGFLRTLFITSKAVARHMGGKGPGVILMLSEAGSKFAVGALFGAYRVQCQQGGFLTGSGRGTSAQKLPGRLHPSTRSNRRAGIGFLHQGPVQTGGSRRRPLGRGVGRRLGAGHHVETLADAL